MVIEQGSRIEQEIPFPTDGIFGLKGKVESFQGVEREISTRILRVSNSWGETKPPPTMAPFLEKQFGGASKVERQPIVRVDVLPLGEGTLFNAIRSRRPGMQIDENRDKKIQGMIAESLERGDPFAKPLEGTPESTWGRVQGDHSISAENVAKFDAEHSLVVFEETHPLRFSREQVVDYLKTAHDIWGRQNANNPEAVYPFLMWQALGKSASSVTHGHLQVVMAEGRHYSKIENLRKTAETYRDDFNANFWTDYEHLHDKLGLMIRRNGAVVMAHVAPIKEREIWMLGTEFNEEFMEDTSDLLDVYINRLGVRSFTLSVARPPVSETKEDWTDFPVLLRLVDRGDPTSPTADIGAMELYAQSVVASDPYDVKRVLSEHWGEAA